MLIVSNPKGTTVVTLFEEVLRSSRGARRRQALFEFVNAGEVVDNGGGSRIYFIEPGGFVTRSGGSCLFFVKNGGRLSLDSGGGSQTVYYERGADIGAAQGKGRNSNSFHETESLSVSVVSPVLNTARGR
jgi:hypothetical protein